MKQSIKTGFSFGLTSGIITTLGLIVGLNFSTNSQAIVIGGILVIAIADSLSDAMGIHISKESEGSSNKEIWEATLSTLASKIIFASSFIIPFLILNLTVAVVISIIWGTLLIAGFSYYIAQEQNKKPLRVIGEHLFITIVVIIVTYFIGTWTKTL